jgi:predicted  nucleic acid-binding Zn-ribbon protein
MSNKISHARIEELNDKKQRKEAVKLEIQSLKFKMQSIKDRVSLKTEQQMRSSSNAAKARRKNAEESSLQLQDELDALDMAIEKLTDEQTELETEIRTLEGWG